MRRFSWRRGLVLGALASAYVAMFNAACGFDALPGVHESDATTNGNDSSLESDATSLSEVGIDARADTGGDAPEVVNIPCGANTDGYEKNAPWPLGARCPTRSNVGALGTPSLPNTLWKYTLPGDGYFGRVAISADETVFATYASKNDGGGLSARMIAFRYDLPAGVVRVQWDIPIAGESYAAHNSPSIAVNGDLYVAGEKSFAVYSRAGKLLRSFPIAGAALGSSPLILASGNAIVRGANTLYAFNASGEVWKHALPSGSTFVGEPVSDGLLSIYVPVSISGVLTGKVLKLSEAGSEGGSTTTHSGPIGTPIARGTNLYTALKGSLIAVSSAGTEFFRVPTKAIGVVSFGVSLPDTLYYFNDGPSPSMALTVSTGQLADLSEPAGRTAAIGTASEDLVYIDFDLLGDSGTFMVAKRKDGSIRWRHKISADTSPEPQAVAMGGTGILYAGAHDTFYAVGQQSQLR